LSDAVKVARNVAWLGAGEAVLKGCLFVSGVLVARGLGPAGMGVFTVSYGAALVLMHVLAGGQVEVLIRETARWPEAGRRLFMLARSHQHRLAVIVVPAAALAAALVPVADLRWTLLSFIPYAFLRRLLITMGAVFKGHDRMEVEVQGRTLELAVVLPLLAALGAWHQPVWGTGLAFTAGAVAGVVWVGSRLRRLPLAEATPLPRAALVREGVPFLGLSMLQQLVARADAFLLASLGVPQAEIGRYGVATAPVQGLSAASQVFAVASYPALSRAAAAGRLRPRWVLLLSLGGVVMGLGLGLLLYGFRAPLVRVVFGVGFEPSADLLGVLAWALPGICSSMLTGPVLASLRRQRWPLISQSALLLISVAANLYVIPRWGVPGCAAVTVGVVSLSAITATVLGVIAASRGAPPVLGGPAIGPVAEG